MEDKEIVRLTKELKLKKFQFNSIYEFSSSLYSSFDIDNIIRIFFSTLMGQMAISKIFFFHSGHKLFKEKGCRLKDSEIAVFQDSIKEFKKNHFYLETENLTDRFADLKTLLNAKQIHYLVNVSDSKKKKIYLGLGHKFNRVKLQEEEIEFSYFIARFALIAIDNAIMINQIIESKRIEHEIKIAKDIQLSLLPQEIPTLQNFEVAVIYEPINEVGGITMIFSRRDKVDGRFSLQMWKGKASPQHCWQHPHRPSFTPSMSCIFSSRENLFRKPTRSSTILLGAIGLSLCFGYYWMIEKNR